MINLGTLKEITDLRSVWSHEALNFTCIWITSFMSPLRMHLLQV